MKVEAPERIRVAQDGDGFWTCREAISGSQEYVRADKLEELAAKYEALLQCYEGCSHLKEQAEASLTEKDKKIEALRELADSAESIFINCSVTDGMCCCGDNMENHPSPMSCGHTPVDHGAYQADLWIQARNAGGKDAE